jgi:hypothetical protein
MCAATAFSSAGLWLFVTCVLATIDALASMLQLLFFVPAAAARAAARTADAERNSPEQHRHSQHQRSSNLQQQQRQLCWYPMPCKAQWAPRT